MKKININADLGEGTGNDTALMPMLASCSIACGGHYGNDTTMRATVLLAKKYGVKIGAHPSFPDLENFGRKILTITKAELQKTVYQQIMRLATICEEEQVPLHHIKPHGALYNYAAIDAPTADAIVAAILDTQLRPKLYAQHDSILYHKAKNLLPIIPEAFIDRRYTPELRLLARDRDGAVIDAPAAAWKQLKILIEDQKVHTEAGLTAIVAETYCIHSDHANSVVLLQCIKEQLTKLNYTVG